MNTSERRLKMEKPFRYIKRLIVSGGSNCLIIPMDWCVNHKLKKGSKVVVEVYTDRIEIRPFK